MFEEYLKALEEIIDKLESGTVGLEESLALYKQGAELSKKCKNIIENGKESIKEIKKEANGISEVPADFNN